MELSDLKKSISELNEEELHSLLGSIRANRRVSKRPLAATKSSVSKTEVSTKTLLDNINSDQAAALLAMMEAMK
uniref:Uncharacterized protein n=1 Tax=viral metagenome TaxID=1070528 RepID=A0A6M3KQU7_9ZZZZ